MKTNKILVSIVCVFTLVVLFSLTADFSPASASIPNPDSSWYNSEYGSPESYVVSRTEWLNFDAHAFTTVLNGFYVLQADDFVTTYEGLVQFSGNCLQEKPALVGLRVISDGKIYYAAQTNEPVIVFSTVFPAGMVQVSAHNFENSYNTLKCNFAFQKVK